MPKLFAMLLLLCLCPRLALCGQLPLPGFSALVTVTAGDCDSAQLNLLANKNTEAGSLDSALGVWVMSAWLFQTIIEPSPLPQQVRIPAPEGVRPNSGNHLRRPPTVPT